jgi:hypothetical protein
MELEEMKASWEALSKKVEKQEQLTTQMIENMTTQNFKSRLNKIGNWELAGTMICYAGAAYLVISFNKISQVYVQVFAIICMAILFVLPIISLMFLRGMGNLNISEKSYAETITAYAGQKIRFQKFQKLNVLFTVCLMVMAMPVLMAIQGKDLGKVSYYWSVIFPVMLVVFLWNGLVGAPLLRPDA